MASLEPAASGGNIQDTFNATYENVLMEESKNEHMHMDNVPAETPEPTRYPDYPTTTSTGTDETAQDTSNAPPQSAHPPPTPSTLSTPSPNIFTGYLATSPTAPLTQQRFHPKSWRETDVEIAITHCGLCLSDISTARSGWSPTLYPLCLGHEIIGTATRVGRAARPGIQPGDRVGVGPQAYHCHSPSCDACAHAHENYCPARIGTYGERYPDGSGVSQGGFAQFARHDSRCVYNIPDGIDSASAAVMLCAGATVYEPLKEHDAAAAGKRVGIIGLGGLGHLGVLFAKAMGCQHVTAFSRREAKRADALLLGADAYVAIADEAGWAERHAASLDLIICTVSDARMPLMEFLALLRPRGVFCQVGIPEARLPPLDTMALVLNGTAVCFSDSASPGNVRAMLELAAEKGVRAWTECRPMREVDGVLGDMVEGRARFRYVLVNEGVEGGGDRVEACADGG